jgi:hypothetical protein
MQAHREVVNTPVQVPHHRHLAPGSGCGDARHTALRPQQGCHLGEGKGREGGVAVTVVSRWRGAVE